MKDVRNDKKFGVQFAYILDAIQQLKSGAMEWLYLS